MWSVWGKYGLGGGFAGGGKGGSLGTGEPSIWNAPKGLGVSDGAAKGMRSLAARSSKVVLEVVKW